MALPWSTPDLSSITSELVSLLQTAVNDSVIPPFNVQVSGSSPETVRDQGQCQLSLYLLHVGRDPFWRNTPRQGPRGLTNPAQALSLNLSYLLTAFAGTDFVSEQQAMSIALHCFQEQPLFHTPNQELTISIEADTVAEMSVLWQAIAAPIRLSALIKVSVVFIAPTQVPPPVAPPPVRAGLVVAPALAGGTIPQLYGLADDIDLAASPPRIGPRAQPGVAVGGQTALLAGVGFDQPTATDVYLGLPGSPPWRLTSPWREAPAVPPVSPDVLRLDLPSIYVTPGAAAPVPPAVTPAPGVYQLSLGSAAGPIPATAIPFAIAARIDGPAAPAALAPDGTGLYTVTGEGFTPAATAVILDTVALAPSATANPVAGSSFVDPTGKTLTFRAPTLPAGRYGVRVRVGGVESPPAYWVDIA